MQHDTELQAVAFDTVRPIVLFFDRWRSSSDERGTAPSQREKGSGPQNLWYGCLHRSCLHECACSHPMPCMPAEGCDAQIVRECMRQAKLRADAIAEFTVSDLLKLRRHGYTSALRIEAAQRPDLEKSELNPALVGVLLTAIEGIRICL